MQDKICLTVENAENSKLLALFNTLEEGDKDIVIYFSELLIKKWRINMSCNVNGNFLEKINSKYGYRSC